MVAGQHARLVLWWCEQSREMHCEQEACTKHLAYSTAESRFATQHFHVFFWELCFI
jgi:hypothetical protein